MVKLNHMELEVDGMVIQLTLEEAKELKALLDELFEEKHVPHYVPMPPPQETWPYWTQPYIVWSGNTTDLDACSDSSFGIEWHNLSNTVIT